MNERDHDRIVRAQIDPLLDELSPAGKMELATRLMLEGARDWIAVRPRTIEAAYRPLDAGDDVELSEERAATPAREPDGESGAAAQHVTDRR